MDDQASLKKDNGLRTNGVLGSLSEFGNDVATLVELQAKLAAIDFKESAERATIPLAIVGAGLIVLLGSVPVLLFGIAALLATWLNIAPGWALVLVAVVALAGSGTAVAIGGRKFPPSLVSFRRSRDELNRNLSWLRTVLVLSGRSVPRRGS
jgi:hypothetical protein